jgi:LPPG:FO 2-phospho-L-lactate transferase
MNAAPPASHDRDGSVLALSGGIGGAKLALGLSRVLPAGKLIVVANTGDDFEHLGLYISPDLDTLMYTLAGIDNPETGWGLRSETWNFLTALDALGGETWFRLGDRDLATHVERTRRLRGGETLSRIAQDFCGRLGVKTRLLPMSDDAVRTRVRTEAGWLDFQDYFVRRRCEPAVTALAYEGADAARAQPEFMAALADPRLRAIVICPSNPFLSIDPILALPGVRAALAIAPAPVVAISPIIAGRAIKGPTAKMMRELGFEATAAAVAQHYGDVLDGCLLDRGDAGIAAPSGVEVRSAATLMTSLADRETLAREVLAFADSLRSRAEAAGASA